MTTANDALNYLVRHATAAAGNAAGPAAAERIIRDALSAGADERYLSLAHTPDHVHRPRLAVEFEDVDCRRYAYGPLWLAPTATGFEARLVATLGAIGRALVGERAIHLHRSSRSNRA